MQRRVLVVVERKAFPYAVRVQIECSRCGQGMDIDTFRCDRFVALGVLLFVIGIAYPLPVDRCRDPFPVLVVDLVAGHETYLPAKILHGDIEFFQLPGFEVFSVEGLICTLLSCFRPGFELFGIVSGVLGDLPHVRHFVFRHMVDPARFSVALFQNILGRQKRSKEEEHKNSEGGFSEHLCMLCFGFGVF